MGDNKIDVVAARWEIQKIEEICDIHFASNKQRFPSQNSVHVLFESSEGEQITEDR